MHYVIGVHGGHRRADAPEDAGLGFLGDSGRLDFFKERAPTDEFEDHIGYSLLFLIKMVKQPNYVRVLQLVVHLDFVLGILVVDLC